MQNHRHLYPLLLLTVVCSGNAPVAQPHYFRHYQVENGLSNNTVFCATQDATGFLWFGTKEGLNRFDGYRFKLFRFPKDENDWAERDLIFCLANDKKGTLWVGTENGLFAFDREKEILVPYFKSLRVINGIQTDKQGLLWFIAGNIVYRYDQLTRRLRRFSPAAYFRATAVCIGADDNIYFASVDGKIYQYDYEKDNFRSYDVYDHSPSFTSCSIQKIAPGGANRIYIGTSCQGIKELNTATGEYDDLLIFNADKTPIYVRDILQVSETQYWFATESGIFILDEATKKFTNLKKRFLDPYSLNDNAVYALCKDREGGVWAGTYFGGVNYYAEQYSVFQKYFADNSDNSLIGSAIREIKNDQYGNLWIGTEDAGLNKLDLATGKITNFSPDGRPGSISYSNIHGLLAINNELWIGTHEHGLDIMDIPTGKVKQHFEEGAEAGALKNNFVVSILETRNKQIYVGTGRGAFLYNRKSRRFSQSPAIPDHILVSTMIEASDSTIWLGTHHHGVYFYNPYTGAHGRFEHNSEDELSLTSNTVNSIGEDSRQNLWIGTEGGGAVVISKNQKIIARLSTSNGLPSNYIFKVLEDEQRNMWLTSSRGLICVAPDLTKIKVFTRSSGLLNDQFNYHSGYRDSSGKLYFGSVKGMISFQPDHCLQNNYTPPVFITGFQINNQEVLTATPGSPLKRALIDTREITLDYDQSSFSIDFAALSYVSPDMTRYKYRMAGLDADWTELAGNRKIYFTDLSPGTYHFRAAAAVNDNWVENEARLTIKILPPWWRSGPAYLLYALGAIGSCFLLVRIYHQRAQEKKEKEIYAAKIDFFTNVAHEIRTPLTLIKGPVENITEKIADYPEIREDVHTLERNTDRLISLVSDVLDFRKTETSGFSLDFAKVDVNQVLQENYLDFKPMALKKGLDYRLDTTEDVCIGYADDEALNKIFSNLISNGIKYSATRLHISLSVNAKAVASVEVTSDGYKIPEEISERIFEPFFRLRETSKQNGTGIGLALSKSLCELLGGNLYLRTDHPHLNIFVFELPLNHHHNQKKAATKTGQLS